MKPRSGRAAEDRVFNAVLNAILDHRLAPGTKLVERDLSELLGVSRGAVRAALARLGHSLLVELRPNRGAVIANPTADETRDVFEARRVIESAVVQGLARSISVKQLAELRTFVVDEQKAYDRGDRRTGQRLSIRFHKLLSELAGNAALDRFMEHLICRTPLLSLAHRGARPAYCGADEHREIVDALARRDPALAARRIASHLNTLEKQLHVEEEPGPAASLSEALIDA
ncbi:MAG TPA: GntR family transcriptional regulator [Burkholderiales bacterium]|jgi:DNA-binding GntR family transcriptional regulator|nr:GntR family transcriptional regulator [Burkholderiales bacterium]